MAGPPLSWSRMVTTPYQAPTTRRIRLGRWWSRRRLDRRELPGEGRTGLASSFIGPRFADTVTVTQQSCSFGECRGRSATRGPDAFPANPSSDAGHKETPD
jgi:hypothetical protein